MTNPITPDELVMLAEFCGKVVSKGFEGHVIVRRYTHLGDWYWAPWQPHLPEGAVQRDEVVEAVATKLDAIVSVERNAADLIAQGLSTYDCVIEIKDEDLVGAHEPTPGDAVCRATLKAIQALKENTK